MMQLQAIEIELPITSGGRLITKVQLALIKSFGTYSPINLFALE